MKVFGFDKRGTFKMFNLDTQNGHGARISLPLNGGKDDSEDYVISNFSVVQAESVAITQCLNGGTYVYAYGHSPKQSQFSVTLVGFVGDACGGKSHTRLLRSSILGYDKGRVSQSKRTGKLTIGDALIEGVLIGQRVSVANPELNMISVDFSFISLKPHTTS